MSHGQRERRLSSATRTCDFYGYRDHFKSLAAVVDFDGCGVG